MKKHAESVEEGASGSGDDDPVETLNDMLPPKEETPLLVNVQSVYAISRPNTSSSRNGRNAGGSGRSSSEKGPGQPFLISWKEIRLQSSLAGPLIVGNLLSIGLQTVSIIFVGHTGEVELSGASLANSVTMVIGYSLLIGMDSALETLCGQAYGAGHYQKLGIYMQTAMLVLTAISIPLALLWYFMEPILLVFGQNEQVASKAGAYGRWLIPTLFATALYQPLSKFLQAQSIVTPMLVVFVITMVFHVAFSWALVGKSSLGFLGAALANSISLWFSVVLLACYVIYSPSCVKCRAPATFEALSHLKSYLKLAIPAASMICLEWWSYDIVVFVSGLLSNSQLQTATISVCVASQTLLYMIPYGIASAISTRVSNELGAGHPQAARKAVYNAVILGSSEAFLVAMVLLMLGNVWGKLFSNIQEVTDAVKGLVPLLALSTTLDGLQTVLAGVARGAGWQDIGAFINLVSFYIAGLPLGCILAFIVQWEGRGLWMGIITGLFLQFISFAALAYFTDWQRESEKAASRVNAEVESCSASSNMLEYLV